MFALIFCCFDEVSSKVGECVPALQNELQLDPSWLKMRLRCTIIAFWTTTSSAPILAPENCVEEFPFDVELGAVLLSSVLQAEGHSSRQMLLADATRLEITSLVSNLNVSD